MHYNGPHTMFYRAYIKDAILYGPEVYALTYKCILTFDAPCLEKTK